MNAAELDEYLLSMPGAWVDYPFGPEARVYKVGHKDAGGSEKMFALIAEGVEPLRLSLKCDPQLALVLRDKYETVLPGYHLNKKHWNTIICSGQLGDDEMKDLMRHSYQLVTGGDGSV